MTIGKELEWEWRRVTIPCLEQESKSLKESENEFLIHIPISNHNPKVLISGKCTPFPIPILYSDIPNTPLNIQILGLGVSRALAQLLKACLKCA